MEDEISRESSDRLLQGLENKPEPDEQPIDFQRYLEPDRQLMDQNFENMNPFDLPGQHMQHESVEHLIQNQSLPRDVFGEEELIQIDNNAQENHGSNAAYQRSRPDGSPMFSQSSGFVVGGDAESVVFRPVKQLDFSSLDDTAMTDVILPRGINRSASTPDHKSKSVSLITREQFIENTGMDRNESPDGNFYELKSSPNQSSPEEELDSKVIFSPLHSITNPQEENFNVGMRSPPLSKQGFRKEQHLGYQISNIGTENLELSQQPLSESDISPYANNQAIEQIPPQVSPHKSDHVFSRQSPQAQSPHHHSISPNLRQSMETREIFVSVPQHVQYGQSPDSLNLSDRSHRTTSIEVDKQLGDVYGSQHQNSYSQGSHNTQQNVNKGFNNRNQHVSNINQIPTVQTQGSIHQPSASQISGKETVRSQAASKPEVKSLVDKKPWNYARNSGNKDSQTYMEKGASKREALAQHAKSRMVREEPKGKVQERQVQQPVKQRKDLKMGSGQSTENLNHVNSSSVSNRNARQATQGQGRTVHGSKGVPGHRREVNQSLDNRTGAVKENRGGDGRPLEKYLTKEEYSPVTQMEQYSDAHDTSLDVEGMEDVRSQLKNMLKISSSESMLAAQDFQDSGQNLADPHQGHVDYSLMSGNSQDNVSELLENFPSITACMWTDNSSVGRNDVSVHNENTRLREMLEKERYRRKHCEQQIQKLNIKLLETQQQLAVAVSTDKRKDIMIEQLDKQLGKVLEGWKKQDHEKTLSVEKSKQEKKKLEDTINKQQQVIKSFEEDMSRAIEAVRQERDDAEATVEELRTQIDENDRNRRHAVEMLETEKEKSELMKQELDMIKDNRDQMDRKFQSLQDRMYQEQDNWFKREQEMLNKIDQVSESNVKVLQQEKDKNEELSNRNKQMEEEIHEIQKMIKKMEMEHDAVQREKESMKVEMGIMEAKFESAQRTLEAELASQMEKEIADQMSELQKRVEKADSELREKHFEHTKELNQRHKEDLEKHLADFHRQMKDRDDENRKQVQEYEEKLQAYRTEISNLQENKQKLEKQRTDILLKLQQMMQSQWNEALSLLATTPQRKRGPSKIQGNVEFSLPKNHSDSDLHISDLSSREQPHETVSAHRVDHFHPGSDEVPLSAEVNMTDFQASLHMQQLLQSLSSLTTQPFPAGQPVTHPTNQDTQPIHSIPPRSANTSLEDAKPASYPSSPNPKKQTNVSQVSPSPPKTSYSQLPYNLNLDENDEFNAHLQMLLNANKPNPSYNVSSNGKETFNKSVLSTSDAENFGQNFVHSTRQNHRKNANDSVDQWLRQSQGSHNQSNAMFRQSQRSYDQNDMPHDLNRSHASHVSSQADDYSSHIGMAVPIRPPQQHESFLSHPDTEHTSHFVDQSHLVQPPQVVSYSPPTKQTRTQALQQDPRNQDSILNESVRLTRNYDDISDRVEEHEHRQGELQHYIQMLLQKPPGDPVPETDGVSLFSHDQTEDLDMNDTAQAVQIQKDLSRIQELRDKPTDQTDRKAVKVANAQGSKGVGNSFQGILQPEHLVEISRYLEKHKNHLSGNTEEDEQLAEIVGLLRNMQKHDPPKNLMMSPKSPKERSRRNIKGSIPKVPETSQVQNSKGQGQPKKERKVASVGPNRHIQGKSKNAWK